VVRGQPETAIVIYATLGYHNRKPALILRRVITDPKIIQLFVMNLLKHRVIRIPAIITVSKDDIFYSNAKRLGIIK